MQVCFIHYKEKKPQINLNNRRLEFNVRDHFSESSRTIYLIFYFFYYYKNSKFKPNALLHYWLHMSKCESQTVLVCKYKKYLFMEV